MTVKSTIVINIKNINNNHKYHNQLWLKLLTAQKNEFGFSVMPLSAVVTDRRTYGHIKSALGLLILNDKSKYRIRHHIEQIHCLTCVLKSGITVRDSPRVSLKNCCAWNEEYNRNVKCSNHEIWEI